MEDEFGDFLQKRVRNLQKRMRRLQQYEETVAQAPGSLNEDQIVALSKKEEVEIPLKIQQNLLDVYSEIQEKQTRSFSEKEIEAAEQRGAAREREKLDITLKLLHRVAVLHQQPDSGAEMAALATLLQQLYTGDDRALAAVDKLHAGSATEKIGGLTFQRIRGLADGSEPFVQQVQFMSEEPASKPPAANGTANGQAKKPKRRNRKSTKAQ
ncbi:hypothetical protein B9G98_00267 [Wickerhamiella sorbophila]|uniref:Uncharacterized protein n=1 Tax=Wickerhamiella sorbophila TaxID=45607 RepID=A0A2T0FCF4_9ASCO|nr:hypothetical protein B9G98_00267 [Wickerhamiella sorbophila]PRT52647.1 hypothetical protein B9G98_00267 [Wickerhamiella sorbophila]